MAMNVPITAELERYVNQKIESGSYQTTSEVVRAGLRLLKEKEDVTKKKEEEDFPKKIQLGLFAVAGVSVVCALLHVFFPVQFDEKTAMFLAVALVSLVTPQITEFKGWGFEVKKEVKQLKSDVRALQIAIKGLVTGFEFDKLVGLAEDVPFKVYYREQMYNELRRLITLRYVETTGGTIQDLLRLRERDGKHEEFDLKQYVRITNEGREYLRIRQRLASEQATEP